MAREQEFLISRGVRPLAIIGNCSSDKGSMLRAVTEIGAYNSGHSIPFILDRGDGTADYGFASHSWAIRLYKIATDIESTIPEEQKHCIIGLLLGYSPDSIGRFVERQKSRIIGGNT